MTGAEDGFLTHNLFEARSLGGRHSRICGVVLPLPCCRFRRLVSRLPTPSYSSYSLFLSFLINEKMDPNFQAQLSPLQQQQLMQEMEKMQMKDSLT